MEGGVSIDNLNTYIRFIQEAEGLKSMTRTAWTSGTAREHDRTLVATGAACRTAVSSLSRSRRPAGTDTPSYTRSGKVYEGDVSTALQPDQDGKDRQERAAVERAAAFLPAVSGREPRAVLDVQTQEKVRERQMR